MILFSAPLCCKGWRYRTETLAVGAGKRLRVILSNSCLVDFTKDAAVTSIEQMNDLSESALPVETGKVFLICLLILL